MSTEHGPCIVQGDRSVLVEVAHPEYERARDVLARFAELEKSPEHVHTYRLSALSLWNAAATGATADEAIAALTALSRYPIPDHVEREIRSLFARYGVCRLEDSGDPATLALRVADAAVRVLLAAHSKIAALLSPRPGGFSIPAAARGQVKRALLDIGYPVDDTAGVEPGAPLPIALATEAFAPYPYQRAAVEAFLAAGGHGVVVLPCGAGKTIVAIVAAATLSRRALVLTTSREACDQWRRELLGKTRLGADDVAVYSSQQKRVGPVTVSTYSMLTRKGGDGPTGCVHFDRLAREPWGLIVYDEVHLLPAPVFRLTAQLQARRRLGLTATLIREDGREGDVFALIGPKRYEVPWRALEASGHIAAATCFEVRVPMDPTLAGAYATASAREQPLVAARNPRKIVALRELIARHAAERTLVMGTYLAPLQRAATAIGAPLITGDTSHRERNRLYDEFRAGRRRRLVLSKVGNFAIDLPEANVLVQISGTMGSRQEEAQRLGRILRPKPGGASFYTIVTRDTCEERHALHRQMFLTEQGYRFYIEDWSETQEDYRDRVLH